MKFPAQDSEFAKLLEYTAELGRNPLMVQGSTGNTSLKCGDTLWIKASGRAMANAQREAMFVPVDLPAARYSIVQNTDPSLTCGSPLRASVETAMHCVIPWRVVIHVHSANVLAWAVRNDACAQFDAALDGLRWRWIPYVASGLALAREIERAVFAAPETQVFVLGNHGIVTAGPDCASACELLNEIDRRISLPSRAGFTREECAAEDRNCKCRRAKTWLASDAVARRILSRGYLYPCHALFLNNFDPCADETEFSDESAAILAGLVEVISRIPPSAPLRYLTAEELSELQTANLYHAPQARSVTNTMNHA